MFSPNFFAQIMQHKSFSLLPTHQETMASGKTLTSIVPIQVRSSYDTSLVTDNHWLCDCGHNKRARVIGIHDDWALWMQCTKPGCPNTWYVCNRCPDVRKKITQSDALKRHHKKQHLKPAQKSALGDNQWMADSMSASSNVRSRASTSPPQTLHCDDQMVIDDEPVLSSRNNQLDSSSLCEHNSINAKKPKTLQSVFDMETDLNYDKIDNAAVEVCFNPASARYFRNSHNSNDESGGLKYMVKRSIAQADFQDDDLKKMKTPPADVGLHMKIAKLAYILPKPQHELLVDILNETFKVGCDVGYRSCQELVEKDFDHCCKKDELGIEQGYMTTTVFRQFRQEYVTKDKQGFPIEIPSQLNDIRKFYTESKFSVVKNLPTPTIMADVPDHAYVSIIDCIRHFLAHGNSKIATIPEVSSPADATIYSHCSQSKKAQEIRRNGMRVYAEKGIKPLCSYLLFWSDDFEPNTSSKQHRASTWIKTMTIATTKEDGHTLNNTFAIAIGKKNQCHDEVERKINNDLEKLQNGTLPPFYVGRVKCAVHIHFELLATLQDQPERRSANHLLHGNATLAARWGVSADHTHLIERLRCCPCCLQLMRTRYEEAEWNLPLPDCTNCLNWDILKDSPHAIFPTPSNYPNIEREDRCRTITIEDKQYLKPFRIEYQGLLDAVSFAHSQLMDGSWSKKNCEAYLKVEGMVDGVAEKLIDHAVMLQSLESDSVDAPHEYPRLSKSELQEELKLLLNVALWERNNTLLSTHVDCIMHMVFLGIVKTVVGFYVPKWLKALSKHASFVDNNGYLLDAFCAMSIDWLVVLSFGKGTMGGWVSENFLGFSRIVLWFYQNIEVATVKVEDIPPLGLAQKKWTKKHNTYWLKIRGLQTSGKADELKTRVEDYMKLNPVPQPLKPTERKVEHVETTLVALVNLLQCVMSTEVTEATINKTEYAIRIFLSAFDKLAENLRDVPDDNDTTTDEPKKAPKSTAAVVSSYNFSCLMNLPQAMSTFGPLRDLWEGGPRGEGFLRFAKPFMSQGIRLNWPVHLMNRLQRMQAFLNLMPKEKKVLCPLASNNALRDRSTKFHKYHSQLEARDRLTECNLKKKTPLSVIILDNGRGECKLYCVVGDYDTVLCINIDFEFATSKKFGLVYKKFDATTEVTANWMDEIVPGLSKDARLGYGVLLPLLAVNENCEASRLFSLVSSNWEALDDSNCLMDLIDRQS